jgi:hypothetical protein
MRAPALLDRFVRDPRTERIVLVQWPNAALAVWLLSLAIRWAGLLPSRATEIGYIGTGALIAWAADEVVRGASPARRVVGLVVLIAEVYAVLA